MTASDIQCRLEAYLELRRSLGFVICYEAYALKELLQYVQAKGLAWPIQSQTILDWIAAAALHCGPAGQRARLIHARGFLRHLKASFPETEVPPPGILAPVIRHKPYLYTPEETAGLLQATHLLWPSGSLQQLALYTLIGLLTSTGLRPGESIRLAVADVRLDAVPPHLEVRHTKFYKSRLVVHEFCRVYKKDPARQICSSGGSEGEGTADIGKTEPLPCLTGVTSSSSDT